MLKKAVENWLIKTNERNYQTPFCQILMNKGYRIIYNSKHRSLEQGKDIIAIDNDNNPFAYQLKTGDINLRVWRNIKGEINELIELPIIHPSINKNNIHKSFLVTNGIVHDEVRFIIDEINEDNIRKKRNYSYLDIIDKYALLGEFTNIDYKFLPNEIEEFDAFLKIYLSDGKDFLDKENLFNLYKIIFKDSFINRTDKINAISSSIIINSYLLDKFQEVNNYYSIYEAWVALAAYILRYSIKNSLEKDDYLETFNLAFSEIINNLLMLSDEFIHRENYFEGEWIGDGGHIYKARITILLGVLASLEIFLLKNGEKRDLKFLEKIKENKKYLYFWGESAFPFFFNIIKYLEKYNEKDIAKSILANILNMILEKNSYKKDFGNIPDPYINVHDILEYVYEINTSKIDPKEYSGNSFILESIISMLVKRNEREILEKNWKDISHFKFRDFKVNTIEDTYTWREENGSNNTIIPKRTQSWKELEAKVEKTDDIPQIYEENFFLLNFFCIISPHRMNNLITILLDNFL